MSTAGCRRRLELEPNEAAAHRLDDRFGPGRSAELHHHAVDVELRRMIADAEAIRDQLVRQTFREQLHDLLLAFGELTAAFAVRGPNRRGWHEALGESRVHHGETAANRGERRVNARSDLIA